MKKFLSRCLLFFLSTLAVYLVVFAVLFFIKIGGTPLVYRATQGNFLKGGGTYIKTHNFNPQEKHDVLL